MKLIRNISDLNPLPTLLAGVLLAIVLVGNQVNYDPQRTTITVEQATDDDGNNANEVVMVQVVDAIASFVEIHLIPVFYFISENLLADSQNITSSYFEKPNLATYLDFIFRQIISPNAP